MLVSKIHSETHLYFILGHEFEIKIVCKVYANNVQDLNYICVLN